MDVAVDFDQQSQIMIDGKDLNKPVGKVVYAVVGTLSRKSGADLLPDSPVKKVKDNFICYRQWNYLLP